MFFYSPGSFGVATLVRKLIGVRFITQEGLLILMQLSYEY